MKKKESFERRVIRIFRKLKNEERIEETPSLLPIYKKNKFTAYLRPVSVSSLDNNEDIENLASWREKHNWWFPAQFTVTFEGTKKWLENQILKQRDRFLFMLETPSGIPFGHVGLYRFNFVDLSCELDNIVRGRNFVPGAMTHVLRMLIKWTFSVLGVRILYLKVYLDNERAIALYKRCGFRELKKIPMKKIKEQNVVRWEEQQEDFKGKAERYHLQMIFRKKRQN